LRSHKPFSHCAGLWFSHCAGLCFISDIYELLCTNRIA
jgi:hypothetical protein